MNYNHHGERQGDRPAVARIATSLALAVGSTGHESSGGASALSEAFSANGGGDP